MQFVFSLLLSLLLTTSLEAASIKELEQKIEVLEKENFRLRQELTMEEEASKLLGQKVLKIYEETVVLENRLKDKDREIKVLEKELARTRELMEKEVASYRKKFASLRNQSKFDEYARTLEKEKKELQEKLAVKEKEIEGAFAVIKKINKEFAPEGKITSLDKDKTNKPVDLRKVLSISRQFNFIIIGFGDLSSVEAGKVFSVFRGEKVIGKVEVTKIRGNYVFARILETTSGEEIKEGDIIQ